jgi:polyisoprenoid-binding protein YceI
MPMRADSGARPGLRLAKNDPTRRKRAVIVPADSFGSRRTQSCSDTQEVFEDMSRRFRARTWCVAGVILFAFRPAAAVAATPADIDPARSTMTVHVSKAGLFRVFADDHEIQAPIRAGFIDDGAPAHVQVVVDAPRMRVLDPGLSTDDREEVQTRMLGPDVLDVSRFPEIRFESVSIAQTAPDAWSVQGQLTLHGQTGPVTVRVTRDHGHYKGSASLKQTAFGITPVTVAGGAVKVKDQLTIDFDVVTRSSPTTDR